MIGIFVMKQIKKVPRKTMIKEFDTIAVRIVLRTLS